MGVPFPCETALDGADTMISSPESLNQTSRLAAAYLRVPAAFSTFLGGPEWSGNEDGLEVSSGEFLAYSGAIAQFLEGLQGAGVVLPFPYVLQWAVWLHPNLPTQASFAPRVRRMFQETGSRWRCVGTLAGELARQLFPQESLETLECVRRRLTNESFPVRWYRSLFPLRDATAEAEYGPLDFQERMADDLQGIPETDLRDWFLNGRSGLGEAGKKLAESRRPERTLAGVLASALDRTRLAGIERYIPQLVGALSLPPRPFSPQELPLGGYADTTTHGHADRLLPSQHALDDLEFLRRFSENELLFFRREEPPTHYALEWGVLLDQGARCWGDVRLVLSAAALALGKQAVARKLPFSFAATSNDGNAFDPRESEPEAWGGILEASDLTLNPALAVENFLRSPSERHRDLVLLTHPKNLREDEVSTATRLLRPGDRLFSLTCDSDGQAELLECRHGAWIGIRKFRVEFISSERKPDTKTLPAPPGHCWTGSIELLPFPFRIGTQAPLHAFAVAQEGDHFATCTGDGVLHLWSLEEGLLEVLPRAVLGSSVQKDVHALAILPWGVAVLYKIGSTPHLAIYDRERKHCQMIPVSVPKCQDVDLWYVAAKNGLVIHAGLNTSETATQKFLDLKAVRHEAENPWIERFEEKDPWFQPPAGPIPKYPRNAGPVETGSLDPSLIRESGRVYYHFRPQDGSLSLVGMNPAWRTATPMVNGKPRLIHGKIYEVQLAKNTLAVTHRQQDGTGWVTLFQGPDFTLIHDLPLRHENMEISEVRLFGDGEHVAFRRSDHRIRVERLREPFQTFSTFAGGFVHEIQVRVSFNGFVARASTIHWHAFSWENGTLVHVHEANRRPGSGFTDETLVRLWKAATKVEIVEKKLPEIAGLDRHRVSQILSMPRGWIVVDRFGQISMISENHELLATFIIFRDSWGAWLPDGTATGKGTLTAGVQSDSAMARIGQALWKEFPKAGIEGKKS